MRASLMLAMLLGALRPLAATAQESTGVRPEAGLEATYWLLDAGNYSTGSQSRWGPTARVGLRPSLGSRVSAALALSYAAEGSFEPGIAGGAVELAVRFARLGEQRRRLNGFLALSLGVLHFDAERQERDLNACWSDPGCQFEGVVYRSGWRPVLGIGLGADLPLTSRLMLQPQGQVLRPIGSAAAGPTRDSVLLRLGMGVGWR